MADETFVSGADLPDPFQREVLDVVGEDAVEIAEALLRHETVRTPKACEALLQEMGDLIKTIRLASDVDILPSGVDPRLADAAVPPGTGAVTLALGIVQRASECRRFGLGKISPARFTRTANGSSPWSPGSLGTGVDARGVRTRGGCGRAQAGEAGALPPA